MKIHPNSTCNTCSKDCKKYYVGECSFKKEKETLYSIDAKEKEKLSRLEAIGRILDEHDRYWGHQDDEEEDE
jgi:hypothetical protein